mgnify:CR=1 FL=1
MQFYLVFALVFSLLVAIFAIQNTEVVIIKFMTWQFPVSLVLVLLGSAVSGALALYFLGLFKQVGSWIKIRQLNHRKNELEAQLKKLEKKVSEMEEQIKQCYQQKEKIPAEQAKEKTGAKEVSGEEGLPAAAQVESKVD